MSKTHHNLVDAFLQFVYCANQFFHHLVSNTPLLSPHGMFCAQCALLLLDCLRLKEPSHEGLRIKLCEIVESLACSHKVDGQL